MNRLHKLKIEPIDESHLYNIYLDDKQIEGVTGLSMSMGVDKLPIVMLEMKLSSIEALAKDCDVNVMDDKFYDFITNSPWQETRGLTYE